MDLAGVCESRGTRFDKMTPDPKTLPRDSKLLEVMATCHSLIKLKGDITGNPLDVKLFEAIGWVMKTVAKCKAIKEKASFPFAGFG